MTTTPPDPGKLLAVNVGKPRDFDHHGRPSQSAIWKTPVAGRVAVRGVNVDGDDQADREAHGGPHKAVYAYAVEDYRWWENEIGRSLTDAEFGENLTTENIDLTGAVIGESWEIGTVVLEVSEPRVPCWRLGHRMDDDRFPKRFMKAGRPGAYLRIVTAGELAAGDPIRVREQPDHGLTIGDVFRIYARDRHEAGRLAEATHLSEPWRAWGRHMAGKQRKPQA